MIIYTSSPHIKRESVHGFVVNRSHENATKSGKASFMFDYKGLYINKVFKIGRGRILSKDDVDLLQTFLN